MFFLIVITILLEYLIRVEGYNQNCETNRTLFIPKGDNATFIIDNVLANSYINLEVYQTDVHYRHLLSIYWEKYFVSSAPDIYLADDRTDVDFKRTENSRWDFTISIRNLDFSDNGTYAASVYANKDRLLCWIILIMDLVQIPSGKVTENGAVRILARPPASLMKRPVINATMLWLLDGQLLNNTEHFLIQDGAVWTSKISRELNGQNVTYRALQDNGNSSEVNITLNIIYGPVWPLLFYPSKTFYTLKNGGTVPDIVCTVDCNPPCSVTWGVHSSDNVLRLGQVKPSSSGEYTCMADSRGNSTANTIERSIYVIVIDDTEQKLGFAIIGIVQALTTICLGVCVTLYCLRSRGTSCSLCGKQDCFSSRKANGTDEIDSANDTPDIFHLSAQPNEAYTEHYETLDASNRHNEPASERYSKVRKDGSSITLEVYENTRVSSPL